MTTQSQRRQPSRLWTVSRLVWRDWRCNLREQRMNPSHTKARPGGESRICEVSKDKSPMYRMRLGCRLVVFCVLPLDMCSSFPTFSERALTNSCMPPHQFSRLPSLSGFSSIVGNQSYLYLSHYGRQFVFWRQRNSKEKYNWHSCSTFSCPTSPSVKTKWCAFPLV